MTAHDLFAMVSSVSNILKEVEAAGMRLEIGGDFVAYKRLRHSQVDRADPYPMFDTSSCYVDASNAFWVCGFNAAGELVHTQAVRLLAMENTTLSEHLKAHRHKYITPGSTDSPDDTFFTDLPALDLIKGRVCYHGDFWLKGGEGGHRSQGFTELLSRVVFEIALRAWSPDFIFGLVPMPLAMKGLSTRYGYFHCEPGGWVGPRGELFCEEFLVWMSRRDMQQFLETPPHALTQGKRLPAKRDLSQRIGMVA